MSVVSGSYHVNLVGMVLPDDMLEVKLQHVGMVSGRKIIKIEVSNQETEDKVLLGEAEVEQPTTSYVFTGQGSQEQGMGMELYNSSPVAKEVWDRADKHFMDNYGMWFTSCVDATQLTFIRLRHYQYCEEQSEGAHYSLWWSCWQGNPPELHVHDL